MPIVIKEIQVKTTVVKNHVKDTVRKDELMQLKKELMKDMKDYLHREYIRKHER